MTSKRPKKSGTPAAPSNPAPPAALHPALRQITTPADENHQGTVFGGVILSLIDQAGYVEARRHGLHRWVTASIERVDFIAPVFTGDILALGTCTESTGRSSVRVRVVVDAERWRTGETAKVTEAVLTMVAVGHDGRSIDFRSPPTMEHERDAR